MPPTDEEFIMTLQQVTEAALTVFPDSFRPRILKMISFRKLLTPESDRACAIMAAALLDEKLKEIIKCKLAADDEAVNGILDGNGGLATFSSRIEMAYLLGLIPKNVRRDLNLLRRIRNEFAHLSDGLSFETQVIAQRCDALALGGKILNNLIEQSLFVR